MFARAGNWIGLALFMWLSWQPVLGAPPDKSSFAFQGHVTYDGAPVSDTCAFRASLWTSETAGNRVAEFESGEVDVIGGFFVLNLDFGSAVFNGAERWLSIEAYCPNYEAAYRVIAARQMIGVAPYAIHVRGMHVDDQGNVGIGSVSPTADFHVERTESDVKLKLETTGGVNYDQEIVFKDPNGEWHVGNRWANPNDAFGIGRDSDKNDLVIDNNGNVGIGTVTPHPNFGLQLKTSMGVWKGGIAAGGNDSAVVMGELFGVATLGAHNGNLNAWEDICINPNPWGGKVGVGTNSPTEKLDVGGAIAVNGVAVINAQRQWVGDPTGLAGPRGQTGPMPNHQWNGASLRFELPNLGWGAYVNLQGPPGPAGPPVGRIAMCVNDAPCTINATQACDAVCVGPVRAAEFSTTSCAASYEGSHCEARRISASTCPSIGGHGALCCVCDP